MAINAVDGCYGDSFAPLPAAGCTMPRGFLVKRTRRACSSYRSPWQDNGSGQLLPIVTVMDVLAPYSSPCAQSRPEHDKHEAHRQQQQVASEGGLEKPGPWGPLPYSPVQPVGLEMKKSLLRRFVSSPATAESFPAFSYSSPFHGRETPRASSKGPPKKHKASRKLHFPDEVTTSPVLGLRIKAEEPPRSPLLKRPPLGDFICQLCKEHYPDPFALAQHKCSRIVRVEYRCPECDKIFSCPANLASHRRWHKPRTAASQEPNKGQLAMEGKENSSAARSVAEQSARVQHQHSVDSSTVPSPTEEEQDEAFYCPLCHKRFRRHAYLRKHLLSHQPYSSGERSPLTYPCALCGLHFPSMDVRDKHRLWHAVREELLLPLEEALGAEGGQQQIFPCDLCPTAFFSSPGLSLHMNKCHSADSRHELPVHMPLGPGC